jgi:hypothetical protein
VKVSGIAASLRIAKVRGPGSEEFEDSAHSLSVARTSIVVAVDSVGCGWEVSEDEQADRVRAAVAATTRERRITPAG